MQSRLQCSTGNTRETGGWNVCRMRARRLPATLDLALSTALLLAACARPHAVAPRPVVLGMSETGLASWYGPEFQGRRTSSGEVFDMYQLTAAHRDLPLGTWVLVTNLDNGRAVEVRVNDRGPFVSDRILDLSYAAADLLGVVGPGVVPVRVVVSRLEGEARAAGPLRFTVQVGSFAAETNARRLHQALAGIRPDVEIARSVVGGDTFYRVRVGNFVSRGEALAAARTLAAQGYNVLIMELDR